MIDRPYSVVLFPTSAYNQEVILEIDIVDGLTKAPCDGFKEYSVPDYQRSFPCFTCR